MPILILIPFGVFGACAILQFWFLKKVRDALIERHPETFLSIEKTSTFPMRQLWKFSSASRFKQLGDAVLDRHVLNLRRLMIIAFVAWAAFRISLVTTGLKPPRLTISIANGSYANNCCGTITLNNGNMTVSGHQVSYVVESDKAGAYVITPFYVGASSGGFYLLPKSFPLKMYIDNETHPTVISLMNFDDGKVFSVPIRLSQTPARCSVSR